MEKNKIITELRTKYIIEVYNILDKTIANIKKKMFVQIKSYIEIF
jgi:hypothetical protein